MTNDGSFRILAARSTEATREACRTQSAYGEVADLFSRLLTGTALYQLAQSPIERVQCSVMHDGLVGRITADVWPGPALRGRVENVDADPNNGALLGPDLLVEVSRQPAHGGEPYISAVPVIGGSIANALQQYALDSEQLLTLFALVAVITDDGVISRAGGMIVQALPGATRDHLAEVTGCLEQASFDELVAAGDDPIDAAAAIFDRIKPHHLGDDSLFYRCRCSRETAVNAVRLLSEDEHDELHAGGSELVICEFCRNEYHVTAADL